MSSTTSDKPFSYNKLYFNHSSFCNITDNPTYNDLQYFYKKGKANAASMPSTLGGGLHGHLGLVTDATTYAIISNTVYVHPPMPHPIVPNNQGTQHQIAENTRSHRSAITMLHTANHIDWIIIKQIQKALDKNVLITCINKYTGILKVPVTDLIQ